MTTQHTPGPWTVYHNGRFVGDETGHLASTDVEGTTAAEAEANARLIAAAPDLLAALRNIMEWWTNEGPSPHDEDEMPAHLFDAALTAIAKVEGNT